MADNEWMYSGRVSSTQVTDEWKWKTDLLVKELARGSKGIVRPRCPCNVCRRRHPKDILEMTKHLWWNGYMRDYDPPVDFSRHERDRGEVMRQRIDGNENDGILNLLDDLRDADMPELPWDEQSEPEEPPEPEGPPQPEELPEEEPEPTARAFIDMMASARRPLYPGAKMSQLDGITQLLADKCMFESTRASFEKTLSTVGNMLPEGHCLPKTMYETKKILKALKMDYVSVQNFASCFGKTMRMTSTVPSVVTLGIMR